MLIAPFPSYCNSDCVRSGLRATLAFLQYNFKASREPPSVCRRGNERVGAERAVGPTRGASSDMSASLITEYVGVVLERQPKTSIYLVRARSVYILHNNLKPSSVLAHFEHLTLQSSVRSSTNNVQIVSTWWPTSFMADR